VSAAGGRPETLTCPEASSTATACLMLPGGRAVLFTVRPGAVGWHDARIVAGARDRERRDPSRRRRRPLRSPPDISCTPAQGPSWWFLSTLPSCG
jgi:hypothetical protein